MNNTSLDIIKERHIYTFKVFGYMIFILSFNNTIGWFRLFGAGIHWKNIEKRSLLSSERNGYTKTLTIGKWRIRFLFQ